MDPKQSETPTMSPYNYCSGNPINRHDPDGMKDLEGVTVTGKRPMPLAWRSVPEGATPVAPANEIVELSGGGKKVTSDAPPTEHEAITVKSSGYHHKAPHKPHKPHPLGKPAHPAKPHSVKPKEQHAAPDKAAIQTLITSIGLTLSGNPLAAIAITNRHPIQHHAGHLNVQNGVVANREIHYDRIARLEHGAWQQSVRGLVLHRTAGSGTAGTLSTWKNPSGRPYGTHFLIGKDGTIYQTANLSSRTWHTASEKRPSINNRNAVGIEFVGAVDKSTDTFEPVTPAQAEAGVWLVQGLLDYYGLNRGDIYNHEDIARKHAREGRDVYDRIINRIH